MSKKILIIAEAGVNHNGSLNRALKLVDIAKECGADIVKFQTFIPHLVASKYSKVAEYQKAYHKENSSQLDLIKKFYLSFDDFIKIKKRCKKLKIEFLSTAFDNESLFFLKSMNPSRYKIPSGEITNLPFIKNIAKLNKKIILSTGMSKVVEIKEALHVIKKNGLSLNKTTLLKCTSAYPTPPKEVNLNAMLTLANIFKLPVGLSDHSMGIEVSVAAAAMGATIIEKHFTMDRKLPGPDQKSSIEPNELQSLVKSIRNIELAMGDGIIKPTKSEIKNIKIGRKSIIALKDIRKGEKFNLNNIIIKRPGTGISPMKIDKILKMKSEYNFKKDDIIKVNKKI